MEDSRSAVGNFIKEVKRSLNSQDFTDISFQLRKISTLLPNGSTDLRKKYWNHVEVQEIFMKHFYSIFLDCLLLNLSIEMIEHIPQEEIIKTFDVFFFDGIHHEAFLQLCATIHSNKMGYKVHKCTSLLESLIGQHKLQDLLLHECEQGTKTKVFVKYDGEPYKGIGRRHNPELLETWRDIAIGVVSLPDKIANKFGQDVSPIFQPVQYIPFVVREVVQVLKLLFCKVEANQDISVECLSILLGKLCLLGYGDVTWANIIPFICENINNYLWNRIIGKFILGVPERCMEATIIPLVKHVPCYQVLTKILGNAVLENLKIQYILTNKLLLMRHFDQNQVIYNIIGYIGSSNSQKELFHKVFLNVFDVWGNGTALKHTSYEQHQYLTRVLLVCIAFLSEKDRDQLRDELLRKLMPAMQTHLDSALPKIRRLGMIVAELITAAIDNTGIKLTFEYAKDEEVNMLISLVTIPDEPKSEQDARDLPSVMPESTEPESANSTSKPVENTSDIDSDDDLIPFDLSHDKPISKLKIPSYLRDCMEGLISQEDPDKLEACLTAAEELVRKNPYQAKEVSVEFIKILLHLQDNVNMPCFLPCRFGAMVAVTVSAPVEVAKYLTTEFFEKNYNLRQRMDMLEVLAAAAQELSQPTESEKEKKKVQKKIEESCNIPVSQDWKVVVQERIESKTRRFSKGKTKLDKVPILNKFAPVAGHFFFPLLHEFDKRETTFNLLGEDHVVLQKFIYTLGIITYSSVHAPVLMKIAAALLDLIWALRYHQQQGVRQSLVFAASMVFLAVPNEMLVTELQEAALEAKAWLEDVLNNDADNDSRKLALQALVLLENSFKQAFNPVGTL